MAFDDYLHWTSTFPSVDVAIIVHDSAWVIWFIVLAGLWSAIRLDDDHRLVQLTTSCSMLDLQK